MGCVLFISWNCKVWCIMYYQGAVNKIKDNDEFYIFIQSFDVTFAWNVCVDIMPQAKVSAKLLGCEVSEIGWEVMVYQYLHFILFVLLSLISWSLLLILLSLSYIYMYINLWYPSIDLYVSRGITLQLALSTVCLFWRRLS